MPPQADDTGVDLPPFAPMLMNSLRAVGYTPSAAIADLVDNSIAAGATKVAIRFSAAADPLVAVVDNGSGMGRGVLHAAMRFGSRDPRQANVGPDLGRFGLGLKTASLSQCRRVTVASLYEGELEVAVWDLDECDRRSQWWLSTPGEDAVNPEIVTSLRKHGHGTAVVWEKPDRLVPADADPAKTLDLVFDEVADHLALVFHRFLAGEIAGSFDITVNGRALPRLDPFLEGHSRGQSLHGETFHVAGHPVTVSPFVLPFPSRLKPADMARVGGRESLKTGHGFYVYRGGRLVVPGGWFRIVPSEELMRLARVRVDVPVQLDHLWKVDIRKTIAEPPTALRPVLKRIVGAVTVRSKQVYTFKGAQTPNQERIQLWHRVDQRDGAATWRLNRQHPAFQALGHSLGPNLESLLSLVEAHVPLHEIYLHMANDLPVAEQPTPEYRQLETLAQQLLSAFADKPEFRERILDYLPMTEPFNTAPDITQRLMEALR